MSSNAVSNLPSATKQSPTANVKPNRLPAPTLFVGPPSRNASQLSVSRATGDAAASKPTRPGVSRQKSALSRPYYPDPSDGAADDNGTGPRARDQQLPVLRKPSDRSIDAKWREMQSTLNEVELTAQSSTHVFGASHAAALDELRSAQVALARAWGRGNEDSKASAAAESDGVAEMNVARFNTTGEVANERQRTMGGRKRGDTETSASTALSEESATSAGSVRSGGGALEDETAQDIRLAGERRAANEGYFKKVEMGVKDVVEKLEKVAEAMRGVEGESRSLWSSSNDETSSEGRAGGDQESIAAVG